MVARGGEAVLKLKAGGEEGKALKKRSCAGNNDRGSALGSTAVFQTFCKYFIFT